ncbi:hypothetical protein C8J57DRAFT_1466637 [Mycena rebaudengoi]|nr:hypothetical protein C8J57DRAFT_1466637 [Mycena rebaudengoi]
MPPNPPVEALFGLSPSSDNFPASESSTSSVSCYHSAPHSPISKSLDVLEEESSIAASETPSFSTPCAALSPQPISPQILPQVPLAVPGSPEFASNRSKNRQRKVEISANIQEKSPNVYINGLPPRFFSERLIELATPLRQGSERQNLYTKRPRHRNGIRIRALLTMVFRFDNTGSAETFIEHLRRHSDLHPSFSKVNNLHLNNEDMSFKAKMAKLGDEKSTNLYIEGTRFLRSKMSDSSTMIAFMRLETRSAAEEVIFFLNGRSVRGWDGVEKRIYVRFADTLDQRELRIPHPIAHPIDPIFPNHYFSSQQIPPAQDPLYAPYACPPLFCPPVVNPSFAPLFNTSEGVLRAQYQTLGSHVGYMPPPITGFPSQNANQFRDIGREYTLAEKFLMQAQAELQNLRQSPPPENVPGFQKVSGAAFVAARKKNPSFSSVQPSATPTTHAKPPFPRGLPLRPNITNPPRLTQSTHTPMRPPRPSSDSTQSKRQMTPTRMLLSSYVVSNQRAPEPSLSSHVSKPPPGRLPQTNFIPQERHQSVQLPHCAPPFSSNHPPTPPTLPCQTPPSAHPREHHTSAHTRSSTFPHPSRAKNHQHNNSIDAKLPWAPAGRPNSAVAIDEIKSENNRSPRTDITILLPLLRFT